MLTIATALPQLHGGTGGMLELWLFLAVGVPLMLLGAAALVIDAVLLLRRSRRRTRTVRVAFVASLVAGPGLVAFAAYFYEPRFWIYPVTLVAVGALDVALGVLSYRRNDEAVGDA